MNRPYKVIVVDDEMISRGYMEMFIKPSVNYEVVASLPFAKDAIKWCSEHGRPDVIIMDVMMSKGEDGLTAAEKLKAKYPDTKIIIATSMADADWIEKAREAGIESFWFKTYSEMSLLEVMDRTMSGELVYPESAPDVNLGRLPASKLTKQQRSILRLLTEGLSNKEIGERIFLSSNTVKDYLDDLMAKSDIHSRTALAAQASRLGIAVSDIDRIGGKQDD